MYTASPRRAQDGQLRMLGMTPAASTTDHSWVSAQPEHNQAQQDKPNRHDISITQKSGGASTEQHTHQSCIRACRSARWSHRSLQTTRRHSCRSWKRSQSVMQGRLHVEQSGATCGYLVLPPPTNKQTSKNTSTLRERQRSSKSECKVCYDTHTQVKLPKVVEPFGAIVAPKQVQLLIVFHDSIVLAHTR